MNTIQFKQEEIITLRHLDKKTGEWVVTEFPKAGGRLRIAHEQNGKLTISTEIVQYDGQVAVVKAISSTDKGTFTGIGMSSIDRDQKIAPAILEMAETRAIARSLRFAGIGVEYCGAEEISHLSGEGGDSGRIADDATFTNPPAKPTSATPDTTNNHNSTQPRADMKLVDAGSNGNGNGNGRLSQKQHSFLLTLADERSISRKDLNQMSLERYAVNVEFLSKTDASAFIGEVMAMAA